MHLYRWRLHLQWGFTLIREGVIIQASILFKDTLQSLKVLTHWVKLSREDKKVSSSQEVTAARFSTPCKLLEKCHNCQLKEKWLCCHFLLMTRPYRKNYLSRLEQISSSLPSLPLTLYLFPSPFYFTLPPNSHVMSRSTKTVKNSV